VHSSARYGKIAGVLGRSESAIGDFVRGTTHTDEKPKGRKRVSTPDQDEALVAGIKDAYDKAHIAKRPREGLIGEVRAELAFPGSYHTALRRTKTDKALTNMKRCRPRETPLDTGDDREKRLHFAEWYVAKPLSYWEEDVIYVDCKRFSILLSAYQKYAAEHKHTHGHAQRMVVANVH